MNTKLTLQLRSQVIEKAKRYAKRRNESLSSLVENYFQLLTENDEGHEKRIPSSVRSLSSVISVGNDVNAKNEYKKHIEEKYLK